MTEGTEKETLITLDFSGTEKKFADTDELRDFMRTQRDAWFWLELATKKDVNLKQVWDPFEKVFRQILQFIEWCKTTQIYHLPRYGPAISFRSNAQIAIDEGFILAEAPIGRFILDLKDNRSPQVASYAVASLNKEKVNLHNPAACEGAYWAIKYLQGSITDFIETQHKVLGEKNEQLIRETTELHEKSSLLTKEIEEQATKQGRNFGNQAAKQAMDFKSQAAKQAMDFESLAAKQVSGFKTIRDETKTTLTDFMAVVKGETVLKSSADYWTEKRVQHRNMARLMAGSTLLIVFLTTVVFVVMATEYFATSSKAVASKAVASTATASTATASTATASTATASTATASEKPVSDKLLSRDDVWKFSIMLLISTLGIWLTRLTTKLFISNLHLGADAYERVTMIKTYLALLVDDKDLQGDDRQLILQTLFRPSSTGIIKDAEPMSILETLVKAFKR